MTYIFTSLKIVHRHLLLLALLSVTITSGYSQVLISTVGSTTPAANAVLYLEGNGRQGLIIPVGNRSLVQLPTKGMLIYDTNANQVFYYNGTDWATIGGGGSNLLSISGNTITLGTGASSASLAQNFSPGTTGFLFWNGTSWIQAPFTLPASTQALVYDPSGTGSWKFQPAATETDPTVKAINGLVKSNGTTISAAAAGTDYLVPNGNGSALTNLNASNITSGTLSTARLNVGTSANQLVQLDASGKLPVVDGSQLINLPAGTETDPTVKAINGLVKSNGTTISAAAAGTDYLTPNGNGSALTNLNATNITSGTLSTARLNVGTSANQLVQLDASGKLPVLDGSQLINLPAGTETDPTVKAINGLVKSNGTTISAAAAGTDYLAPNGNGSALTNLNATNITSGTLSTARLNVGTSANQLVQLDASGKLPVVDGSQLTNLPAGTETDPTVKVINGLVKSNGTTISVAVAGTDYLAPNGNGSALTNLNASNISSGIIGISNGGTGGNTIASARIGLGLGTLAALNSITSAEITNGTITDIDVNATAGIAGSKINPSFGLQPVSTTSSITAGSAGQFVVNTSGNISKINNVVTSFPIAQGAANSVLTNDGAGNLSWGNGSGWGLTGNSGTIDNTNFIGTTDAVALVMKVNNVKSGRIEDGLNANVFFGQAAGISNAGIQNTGIGTSALGSNTSGSLNTALGFAALQNVSTGGSNTGIGRFALINTNGTDNTGVGQVSLISNTIGNNNSAFGSSALQTNTTGNNNTGIGYGADVTVNNLTNATAIGYNAKVGASNALVLGGTGSGAVKVGIGLTVPSATLDVAGNIKITDGTEGEGKVLTSDANGLATWETSGSFSGFNQIPKGDGSTLVASSIQDDGATVQITESVFINSTLVTSGNINGLKIGIGGNQSTIIGQGAESVGPDNTAIGFLALTSSSGSNNTAIGSGSMRLSPLGNGNTAVGSSSLGKTTGDGNTAVGSGALQKIEVGSRNTALGYNAGFVNGAGVSSAGNNNTLVGYQAGVDMFSGNDITLIGYQSLTSASGFTNATAIGSGTIVDASNKVRIGNSSVTVIQGQVSFTAASDRRLKKNIEPIEAGLDFIQKLKPVSYQLNSDASGKTNWGFIAQDIEALLGNQNAVLTIGGDSARSLGLRYSDFVAPLVKALQEQQQMIEALQQKANQLQHENTLLQSNLESRLKALEAQLADPPKKDLKKTKRFNRKQRQQKEPSLALKSIESDQSCN